MNNDKSRIYSLGLMLGIGSTVFLAGCGVPAPGDGGGAGNGNDNGTGGVPRAFVGADTCAACHPDIHADWSETAHAGALDTLEAIGQGENEECLPCHVVGFQEDGFVSRTETPQLVGVQCENCHGSATEHVANPGDASLRPTINMSASLCGGCHTDPHHPTFDEWQLSKHATALEGLRANPFANDECLECHSQDYRAAVEDGQTPPTLDTAQLSIECATCHDPHGGVAQANQLRKPIGNLCGECHTVEEVTVGGTPHHPQIEMLTGIGPLKEDGSGLQATHAHSSLAAAGGQACAQCHVVQHAVDDPTEDNPNVTGHTFNPFDESITTHQAAEYTGCAGCHTETVAAALRSSLQSDVSTRLNALALFFDESSGSHIDPNALSSVDQQKLAVAKFDYQFIDADGSRGVHNPSLARATLDEAERIVQELAAPQ